MSNIPIKLERLHDEAFIQPSSSIRSMPSIKSVVQTDKLAIACHVLGLKHTIGDHTGIWDEFRRVMKQNKKNVELLDNSIKYGRFWDENHDEDALRKLRQKMGLPFKNDLVSEKIARHYDWERDQAIKTKDQKRVKVEKMSIDHKKKKLSLKLRLRKAPNVKIEEADGAPQSAAPLHIPKLVIRLKPGLEQPTPQPQPELPQPRSLALAFRPKNTAEQRPLPQPKPATFTMTLRPKKEPGN